MDMLEIWNQVLENLECNVSPVGFNIQQFPYVLKTRLLLFP